MFERKMEKERKGNICVCMCGHWHACLYAYLYFSSAVGAGQYERYPVPTHPRWSWLNDPWPEDVHARKKRGQQGSWMGTEREEEGEEEEEREDREEESTGVKNQEQNGWKLQQIKPKSDDVFCFLFSYWHVCPGRTTAIFIISSSYLSLFIFGLFL